MARNAARPPVSRGLAILAASWVFISLVSLGFTVLVFANAELYFPLYPAIDTVFSDRYSEERFDAIHAGMTSQEVAEALGPPFSLARLRPLVNARVPDGSVFVLGFSHDGAFPWGDFAWLGRNVYFDGNNRVTGTSKGIHHD
jgi:hypothetical protein